MFLKIIKWIQLRTIRSFAKSLPPNSWWLYGSWAREVILEVPHQHEDIDVYVLSGTPVRRRFLFSRFLDISFLRQEDNLLAVERAWEISSFPLEAVEGEPRVLKGIPVYTVSTEFLFLQMTLSTKERHRQIPQLLLRFIDQTKLKRITLKVQPTSRKGE